MRGLLDGRKGTRDLGGGGRARPGKGPTLPLTETPAVPGLDGWEPHPGSEHPELAAWVARELHDIVVQGLTVTLTEVELARRDGSVGQSSQPLDRIESEVRRTVVGVRELLARLRGRPPAEADLVDSITLLLSDLETQSGLLTVLDVSREWPRELPQEMASNLRRIVQETLANVRKHSGASKVEVSMGVVEGGLIVQVADDGLGSDELGCDGNVGDGVLGMRERAALLGGSLEIISARGRGTVVSASVRWSQSDGVRTVRAGSPG